MRWRIGIKDEARRTQTRDKGGFRTKEDARRYFYDHVLPALDAGHASPDEQHEAIREETREQEASRKSVGEYFDAMIESKPVHLREETYDNYQPVYRLAIDVFGRETLLDAIAVESVERLLGHPTPRGKSPSPDTIRRRYLVLRESLDKTDTLRLRFEMPWAGAHRPHPLGGELWYSLMGAVEDAAADVLQVEPAAVGALVSSWMPFDIATPRKEVVLFDRTPGGSGIIWKSCSSERFSGFKAAPARWPASTAWSAINASRLPRN